MKILRVLKGTRKLLLRTYSIDRPCYCKLISASSTAKTFFSAKPKLNKLLTYFYFANLSRLASFLEIAIWNDWYGMLRDFWDLAELEIAKKYVEIRDESFQLCFFLCRQTNLQCISLSNCPSRILLTNVTAVTDVAS